MWWPGAVAVFALAGAASAQTVTEPEMCGWQVTMEERWGSVEGGNALTAIADAALAPDENAVLLAQPDDRRVRLFTLSGETLGSIGREGWGPGDVQVPVSVGFHDEAIWVWDLALGRLSFFASDAGFLDSWTLRPGGRAAVLEDGSAVYAERTPAEAPAGRLLERITEPHRDPGHGDTLHVMSMRAGDFLVRSGPVTRTARQPLSDDPLWGAAPNGRWVAVLDRRTGPDPRTASMTLYVWRSEGWIREAFEWPYEPVPLRSSRLDSLATAFSESARRAIRTRAIPADPADFSVDAVRGAFYEPAWTPPASALVVASGGTAWLRAEHRSGSEDRTRWAVVDLTTGAKCEVDVPAGWRVLDVGTEVGVAATEGAYGIPQVTIFRLQQLERR